MAETMLPCPFCGGIGHIQTYDGSSWMVWHECDIDREPGNLRKVPSTSIETARFKTREGAIAAWNRRPTARLEIVDDGGTDNVTCWSRCGKCGKPCDPCASYCWNCGSKFERGEH